MSESLVENKSVIDILKEEASTLWDQWSAELSKAVWNILPESSKATITRNVIVPTAKEALMDWLKRNAIFIALGLAGLTIIITIIKKK